MTIFLCPSQRYRAALETFDPMRGEWFLGILDPWPHGNKNARLPWQRIAIVTMSLILPILLFAAIRSVTLGGRLVGSGGLVTDIAFYSIGFFFVFSLVLIPMARRMLGDLINELILLGIAKDGLRNFSPHKTPKGNVLRWLEWLSRVDGRRGLIWYCFCLGQQVLSYRMLLSNHTPTWIVSIREPGTLFHFLSVGNVQPNLGGIWAFVVYNPLVAYFVVLIARLFIVFACLCAELARSAQLSIVPCHPDATGGLKPVGQVALFFSLFSFVIGVDLAGMTVNELLLNKMYALPDASKNLRLQIVFWGLYLLMGSVLFFLPLVSLRKRMADAKRRYLLDAMGLHAAAERKHRGEAETKTFQPDTLQGLAALDTLIRQASEMAVWPFDKGTFLRYAGLLISPLAPFLGERLPTIARWLFSK